MIQFVWVGIGEFVDGLLQASLCDCFGRRVFHKVVVVVKEKSVLLAPGEARHRRGGVASGFAGELVAGIMAEMQKGFVVCVAADPERLERVARVARGFSHEDSVP